VRRVSQEIKELLDLTVPQVHQVYREPLEFKDSQVLLVPLASQAMLEPLVRQVSQEIKELLAMMVPQVQVD
jgi:hypothetical protein